MDLTEPRRLAAEMAALIRRSPGVREACVLTRPIVLLLARGKPVAIDELAAATGVPAGRLKTVLQRSPYAEWSGDGRLEGFGLTLRPTPHSVRTDGVELYVWTAADAFISAVLLERRVRISTSCHVTGVPIRVEVSPSGVLEVEPPTAVVTALASPATHDRLRWLDASRQVFFRSPQAAWTWIEEKPGYVVLDMHQALEYATQLMAAMWRP